MPAADARSKYSNTGGFTLDTFRDLGLPASIVGILVDSSNHALSANTWKSYKTAEKHVQRAERATGTTLSFPFTTRSVLIYVGYLLGHRELSAATVGKYLSALRMVHIRVLPSQLEARNC